MVFDPYADGKVPGLKPLRIEADEVLCSHEHSDHNFREAVTLRNRSGVAVSDSGNFHLP